MSEQEETPTIMIKGLSAEELVSPRFWEMRRLMVGFGEALQNCAQKVARGDMVMITDGSVSMNGPWIAMGIDAAGFVVLANGAGQMTRCPVWSFPICATVVSKASEAQG